jgi:hypothetical protein
LAALAAAAAVAAPASAQNLPSFAPVSFNAGVGYTGISLPSTNLGAVTFRAGADFGKYVGLEAEGAFGAGDADNYIGALTAVTKTHLNDEYAGYAVVRYPVLPNANVFARGGYGHSDIKVSAFNQTTQTGGSVTAGADSWNYGAGAQYFFDAKNGLRAEYTRYDFVDRGVTSADTWSISYVRKF